MVEVPTIGQSQPYSLNKKVIIGVGVIAIVTGSSFFVVNEYLKSYRQKNLGDKLIEFYNGGGSLKRILEKHPDITNKLTRDSLEALDSSYGKVEPETYMVMFDKLRDKAEENPEIMDHFGPKAQRYVQNKIYKEYKEKLEDSLEKGKKKLEEYIKDLKENEKIKEIYTNIVEGIKTMVGGSNRQVD